jgi:hypothetical protein
MGPRKHAPPADEGGRGQHAFAARQIRVGVPALRMAAKAWHPAIMAMEIGAIGDRIGEVMCAYDNLCQAAGIARPYELAFRLMEASRHVRWKVKQVLDGKEATLLPRKPDRRAPDFPPSATGESR